MMNILKLAYRSQKLKSKTHIKKNIYIKLIIADFLI